MKLIQQRRCELKRAPSPRGGKGWDEGERRIEKGPVPLTRRASRVDLSPVGREAKKPRLLPFHRNSRWLD